MATVAQLAELSVVVRAVVGSSPIRRPIVLSHPRAWSGMNVRSSVLLTVAEMYRADASAAESGIPGLELMENAGRAVARVILERSPSRPTVVLCGPGDNGGDGWVVARLLKEAGRPVRLASVVARERLKGDAAGAAARWDGPIEEAGPEALDGAETVVDALFGAGLTRPLEGRSADLVRAIGDREVFAVDIPSGIDGDTGAVSGAAVRAGTTITFFRPKPGHLLLPGRLHVGELVVADIGVPASVLDVIRPRTFVNDLGTFTLPRPRIDAHKFARGHVVILGGGRMTGAARLAARAAARVGAGLVSIVCPASAFPIYAASCLSVMVEPMEEPGDWARAIADPRGNALLLGPGAGVTDKTRERVATAAATGKPRVLDADALTVLKGDEGALREATRGGNVVLTPHEGEFARLFDTSGSKLDRARRAAERTGAVVLLKGPDTVIAAPDAWAAINTDAPPDLATAGSGDVLAGLVVGLLASGMTPFDAARAGAWLHAAVGREVGPGLIADDLPDALPRVLARNLASS